MSGSWVVVQKGEEVERALALEGARSGSLSFLATSAAAYFALRERDVLCRGTHQFASRESTNEVALENFGRLRGLTIRLDEAVHETVPGMPEGFKPFEAFEYDVKKIVDATSFALMELLGFAQAESPSEILYWDESQEHGAAASSDDGPPRVESGPGKQTVTSELLGERDWWAGHGVVTKRIPGRNLAPEEDGSKRARPKGWRSRLREILNPNRTEGIRLLGWAMSPALSFRGGHPRLLVVGKSDNAVLFVKHAIS
ncbi:MAG: hypothetical protein QF473_25620, partial [Planctomycetota bacterium]|nr:hypothetical protein [Planctomycetota bacterium]